MKSKVYRDHDREMRKEKIAFKIIRWLVTHKWISGIGLAGYGLAEAGYTDYPDIAPDQFTIRRTGAGPRRSVVDH